MLILQAPRKISQLRRRMTRVLFVTVIIKIIRIEISEMNKTKSCKSGKGFKMDDESNCT